MFKTSELIWQDTQHQTLFRLLEAMRREECDLSVITQLRLYADHHFCLEEAYMEELAYPGTEHHIKAHNRFRYELAQLSDSAESLTHELRTSLSQFLEEWLKRHILGVDKDFESFVMESSRK